MPTQNDSLRWLPFTLVVTLFLLAFTGLAYSFFPYVVPDKLTIWEAAASRESLMIILIGTLVTLPMIIAYTVFAYRVFGGKAMALSYD
jgi:cytochrome d ubiquinol oxidase subunit II